MWYMMDTYNCVCQLEWESQQRGVGCKQGNCITTLYGRRSIKGAWEPRQGQCDTPEDIPAGKHGRENDFALADLTRKSKEAKIHRAQEETTCGGTPHGL